MASEEDLRRYLSKRWFPLPPEVEENKQISSFRFDDVRFKTCHSGRRSFKTELPKRGLVAMGMATDHQSFFFGAPTREQAKRIAWEDFKLLIPKIFIADKSESELWIKFVTGSELWILGFDKPERFEGKRWNGGVLTEFPHFKESAWNETIAPALRDTRGWAIIEGVPEGKNHYFELCEYARTSGDPEWKDYSWKTSEVMDKGEVEKERGRLDERTFRQEYEGSFESYEGRAYVYYDSNVHKFLFPFIATVPISLCLDFNIDPCLWEFAQDGVDLPQPGGGTKWGTYFFDEIKQRQTDIWKMCGEVKQRLTKLLGDRDRKHKLVFYGDYTSSSRRDVSAVASSWQIIKDEFGAYNADFRLKSNPRVIDRINAVNSRLRSADGSVHVGISPNCVELNKDMEQVDMQMITNKTGVGDRTHSSDALGYMINYLYPVIGGGSYYINE